MTGFVPLMPLQARAWQVLAALAAVLLAMGLLGRDDSGLPVAATPFAVALLFVPVVLAMQRRRIAVRDGVLDVAATLFTRRVAIDALDLDAARVVDLAEHTALRPTLGLMRFSLPGLRAGHFLLRDRSRAFCLLTAFDRVLALPVRDGTWLLLSPERPQDLLRALREVAAVRARR